VEIGTLPASSDAATQNLGMSKRGYTARVQVLVEALGEDPPFDLHVEPWGEMRRIAPGIRASVTFLGPHGRQGVPTVSVSPAPGRLIVCAEAGLEDYLVEVVERPA
jgi:hypothetical protein